MTPSDNEGNCSNPKADIGAQQPAIRPARLGSGNQVSFPPEEASGEPDRLLDIDGLLKLVRLISVVKEGGSEELTRET
jgi:hypothetical protein